MDIIEKALKQQTDVHRDSIRRTKSYEAILDTATEIAERHWTTKTTPKEGYRHYTLIMSTHLQLSIHLSKLDSLKYDIMDILEAILDANFIVDREYHSKGDNKNWDFKHSTLTWKDIKGRTFPLILELYVKYSASERCKMVKTDEMVTPEPYNKTILVCED